LLTTVRSSMAKEGTETIAKKAKSTDTPDKTGVPNIKELELAVANLRTAAIIFAVLLAVTMLWLGWLNLKVARLHIEQSTEQYPMMQQWQQRDNNSWYR